MSYVDELLRRREAIITDHVAMEKFDPHFHGLALKGDRISERPIGFLCGDEVVIVGACVPKIIDLCRRFAVLAHNPEQLRFDVAFSAAVRICKRVAALPPDQPIVLATRDWNGVLHAASELHVDVVSSQGVVREAVQGVVA